jgi:L-aspartate oxidase
VEVHADFLIVGSGIAALRAAAELGGDGEIAILTKGGSVDGSTGYAQGGIAAAISGEDSEDLHAADTISAGDGLCDEAAVRTLVGEGPRYVHELIEWGARFDRDAGGALALAREGAHSVRRVLHARDATGRELERTLWGRVSERCRVRVFQHTMATDALVHGGECIGMHFIDQQGNTGAAIARATLLATGGAGQVFAETTNPRVATGDGIAIAWRAGAEIVDVEFVQFHPTALRLGGSPRFLLSEALRGEGAQLVNEAGEAFMTRYDPAGDLAARDVVARAIALETERTGGAYLSLAHLDQRFVHDRFPQIAEKCREFGIDLAADRVPVGPAAHYIMGGVGTDLHGRTSIPRLFAAGEVACTGVHGANRLASNSLLEGLVFGARAGAAMKDEAPLSRPGRDSHERSRSRRPVELPRCDVAKTMWELVGLFREGAGLDRACRVLDDGMRAVERALEGEQAADLEGWRTVNSLAAARLIAGAARRRKESRGAHFRSDYPARDEARWNIHLAERIAKASNED